MFYIKENVHDFLLEVVGWDISTNVIAFFAWILFSLLCFVRKIEKFAFFHIFADFIIVITLLVCVTYGALNM